MPNPSYSTAPWHSLVIDAEARLGAHLEENIESYLVFMLMRYLRDVRMVRNVLALAFLEGLQKQGKAKADAMQTLGDQCLLYAGLFPEQARRRHVSMDYFVRMGRSAYGQLAQDPLFIALTENFVLMMDVLAQIRSNNPHNKTGNLLDLQELWEQTGSRHAANCLHAQGIIPAPMPSLSKH